MSNALTTTKTIITCAITGHITNQDMAKNLPITPYEQAIAAKEAIQAGASIIHLHVREDDGSISLRPERYHKSIALIKEASPEALIEISMRGIDKTNKLPETIDRGNLALINSNMWGNDEKLKPDICALNISTRNIGANSILVNSLSEVERQVKNIYELGIIPRCDIYDIGDILLMNRLIDAGILRLPVHALLIFGSYSGIGAERSDLEFMLTKLPKECHWTALGTGKHNFDIAQIAVEYGGSLRTGFEDTTFIAKGIKAESNAQMVAKLAEICRNKNISIAGPNEAKLLLSTGIMP